MNWTFLPSEADESDCICKKPHPINKYIHAYIHTYIHVIYIYTIQHMYICILIHTPGSQALQSRLEKHYASANASKFPCSYICILIHAHGFQALQSMLEKHYASAEASEIPTELVSQYKLPDTDILVSFLRCCWFFYMTARSITRVFVYVYVFMYTFECLYSMHVYAYYMRVCVCVYIYIIYMYIYIYTWRRIV